MSIGLAGVVLGAALMAAPAPPVRPAVAPPAPSAEMQELLDRVRSIRGRSAGVPAGAAAAAPGEGPPPATGQPAAGFAPARAPLPPRRRGAASLPVVAVEAAPAARPAPMASTAPAPAAGAAPGSTGRTPGSAGPLASPLPPRPSGRVESPAASAPAPLRPGPRGEDHGAAGQHPAGQDATPERRAPQMVPRQPLPARPAVEAKVPVCRDPRIEGTMIPRIMQPNSSCGIAQPVRVNAIAGIRLSTPATLDCNTASTLATWMTGVVVPAARAHLGSGIEKMWVMGSYACRRRNNMPSGKLSEHARGRAVDVGGVWLADGRQVSLLQDWGKGAGGRFLAQIRGQACGLFHTVLGPGSDRHHRDHLHLDTSTRGGRPYCK